MVNDVVACLPGLNTLLEWFEGWCLDYYMRLRWKWYIALLCMSWKAWDVWLVVYTWY